MKFILSLILVAILNLCSFGQSNGALDFIRTPTVPQQVTVSGINASSFTGLSLEAWIYLTAYNGGPYTGSYIFGKEGPGCVDPYGSFVLLITSSNHSVSPQKLDFGLDPGGVHTALLSSTVVGLNQWHHVAATYDGSYMRIYLNGEIEDSLAITGSIYGFDSDMHIGNWTTCADTRGFNGTIDEARVWNVARTKEQIRDNMYQELIGTETGLHAYYKFNDGSGQTAVDSGPNSLDGYLGSTTSVDANDPSWISSTAPMPYYTVQNGNWSSNSTWATGQFVPSTDWASVKLNNDIDLDMNEIIDELEIDAAGSLAINPGNQFTVVETLTNSSGVDGLLIQSDASGTGSLIESSGNVNATVNRFLSQNMWHFIGMPVSMATAATFYLSGGSDIYLRTHIESSNSWNNWITNVNTNLVLGRGYECWVDDNVNQDETIQFEGILNSGDFTTGIGNFYGLQFNSGHGLNLISNPYPSAIKADIHTWTKTSIANSVWTWDGTAGNYVYWNGIDGTNGDGYGTLTNGVIPAMQGFFVLATASTPSLTIPQESRMHSSQSFYKNIENLVNILRIDVEGNGYRDAAYIRFDENAIVGFDATSDVQKLFGLDEAPQLFFTETGQFLSINTLPDLKKSGVVDLNFSCEVGGFFTINTNEIENSFQGKNVVLEDIKENIFQNLNENTSYSFNYDPEEKSDRFRIHFNYLEQDKSNEENDISISYYSGEVDINIADGTSGNVMVLNIQGQKVIKSFNFKGNTHLNLKALHGFYLINVNTDSAVKSRKVFVQ